MTTIGNDHNECGDGISLRHSIIAHRMVLGCLNAIEVNQDLHEVPAIIAAEIHDCPICWREIAAYLAGLAATGEIAMQDGDDWEANAAKAANRIEARIATRLDISASR